ncbi:MAG: hypothetical protein U0X73_09615 [Thermoanaerobaculia bacterium]
MTAPLRPTPRFAILPVLHDRVDFAGVVRRACDRLDPAAVAVELPPALETTIERALARLPALSLVMAEEPGRDALAWIAAPGDPFVEGLRWARERDRPRRYVDPDLPVREKRHDSLPDPYALLALGDEAYLESLGRALRRTRPSAGDRARESGMAYHLERAAFEIADERPILVLVGAAHAERLAAELAAGRAHAAPLVRRRRGAATIAHLHPESLSAVLPDPPLAHAVWERLRDGRAPAAVDLASTFARRVTLEKHGLKLLAGEPVDERQERRHAVVDWIARHARSEPGAGGARLDRWRIGRLAFRVATGSYRETTNESVAAWQRRLFLDFARRYARVSGALVPGLYEWVVAARGVADDNFAWEMFDVLRTVPWQEESAEIETVRVDGEFLELGTRRVRFRRRFFRVKQRPRLVPVRPRPEPADPADWLRAFDDDGLCSYPPEDVVIEDYGRFLEQKAVALLSAERRRTQPFEGSLLDGIDLRETIRHLAEGRIYVQELARAPGDAGAVVLIFDRDPSGERFPFCMTWLGEHDQESDMAFYASDPGEAVVGPGILRASYGGLMLTQPRGRLWDVWNDSDYSEARDKPEVLLWAAIDYNLEKLVVHVAAEAPSESAHRRAARQAKRIVHIPLGALSPTSLRRIRRVHLLAGKDKRAIAKPYVW